MTGYQAAEDFIRRVTGPAQRPIALLLGSALSLPESDGMPGVPGVRSMLKLLDAELASVNINTQLYNRAAKEVPGSLYQEGFRMLIERAPNGIDRANALIKRAVLQTLDPPLQVSDELTEPHCRNLLRSDARWYLRRSVLALGRILAAHSDRFPLVLTTNFDPLIELATHRAGGTTHRTVLHADGYLGSHGAHSATHVVYLHGYWFGSDTMHSAVQLTQDRPQLQSSLIEVLSKYTLLQMGYGGWDDIVMGALQRASTDHGCNPDILWASNRAAEEDPARSIAERLRAAVTRHRIQFYAGVDLHEVIPRLERALSRERKLIDVVVLSRHERDLGQVLGKLNLVQNHFGFLPAATLRSQRIAGFPEFHRNVLNTDKCIETIAQEQGADCFLTLVIVDQPIESDRMSNLFSDFSKDHRVAIITTQGAAQIGIPIPDYIRYYIIRYVLGQALRTSNHDETRDCLFDMKMWKKDILLSLRSARLCDKCNLSLRKLGEPDGEAVGGACKQLLGHMALEHN